MNWDKYKCLNNSLVDGCFFFVFFFNCYYLLIPFCAREVKGMGSQHPWPWYVWLWCYCRKFNDWQMQPTDSVHYFFPQQKLPKPLLTTLHNNHFSSLMKWGLVFKSRQNWLQTSSPSTTMRVEKKQWRAAHFTKQESMSHTGYPHKHLPEWEDSNMTYDRVNIQ